MKTFINHVYYTVRKAVPAAPLTPPQTPLNTDTIKKIVKKTQKK